MKNAKSKKIKSTLFRKSLFGWIAVGAVIAFVCGAAAIMADEEELIGVGIVALAVSLIIGIIVGSNVSSKFANKLKRLESIASIPFDEDELQYLDSKKTIALGQDWLMINQEKKINLLPKEGIVSVDSHNERKPGMKKLWLHAVGVNKESIFGQYEACEPDILDTVAEWLKNSYTALGGVTVVPGGAAPAGMMTAMQAAAAPAAGAAALMAETVSSAAAPAAAPQPQAAPVSPLAAEAMAPAAVQEPVPAPAAQVAPQPQLAPVSPFAAETAAAAPVQEPAPAAPAAPQPQAAPVQEPVRTVAPGECPHCFGPNDPSAEVCQWCGSRLK